MNKIKRVSVAPGVTVAANLTAVTGIVAEVRGPLPTPAAEIEPADGSIFTVAVNGTMLEVTGVAEGQGTVTLINPDVVPANPTEITVTCQREAPGVRWILDSPVVVSGTPPDPFEIDVLVNDQRVQLTFSGDGSDGQKSIDWGDGAQESVTDTIAQHDYAENGTYGILVTPEGQSMFTLDPITIDHYPTVQVATDADPIATMTHDKGDIATTIDWGDGTVDDVMVSEASHMYAANGYYTVTTTIGGFHAETNAITIVNADVGGVSSPPTDAVAHGPFDIPSIQPFWVYTSTIVPDWFSAAINVDDDPEPDVQVFGPQLAAALRDFPAEAVSVAIAKVREVWGR